MVNGIEAIIDNNTFTATGVPLEAGENIITITAIDSSGHPHTIFQTITFVDIDPPIVQITGPVDGEIFNTDQITVTGTVTDNSNQATVTVNNVTGLYPFKNYSLYNLTTIILDSCDRPGYQNCGGFTL